MLRIGVAALSMLGIICSTAGVRAQDTIELPGIVVTAGPLETTEDQAFASVTTITEEDIESGASRTLGQVLFTKPGITSSTFAPGASRPIIRGLDNTRIKIQENGIGTHDVSAVSEDHGVPIDPLAAQKIEVIRGPASLRWGSQAIGGVVDVSNNRIPSSIPGGKYNYLETDGAYSSVDNGSEGSVLLGAGAGNFAFHADLHKRKGSNYETPHGIQQGTGYEAEGGALGASLVFRNGYIGVSYSKYSSLYFIPGEEAVERNLHIDLNQSKITSKGEYRPQNSFISNIKYWFGYTDYKHDEIGGGHHHGEEEELEEDHENELAIGSTFKNKQYEARTEVLHNPVNTSLGDMKGAVGVEYGFRDLSASGEGGELIAPSETVNVAAYIFEEFQTTQNIKLQFAGRIEKVEVDGAAADFKDFIFDEAPEATHRNRRFIPYSLSTGALYQFSNGYVARIVGQYVERAPDALELFAKGPHEATETFEIGNPDLDKEKAHTIELGLKNTKGRFKFDGSAYYTRYEGFIYKNFTGNSCEEDTGCQAGDGSELTQINYDQNNAVFYGVELSGSYDVARIARGTFGIDGQYDFVRAKFDDGANVPRITPQRAGFGVYYRDADTFARIGALHAFRQDDIGENETATSGYTLLNAEVNYTVRFNEADGTFPELTIGLKGENLLDDDVRNHVSFKKDDVLLPGRNVMLRGKIKLN